MRVLHVTEALGGGVQRAIGLYIESTPELDHHVLGRRRANEDSGSFEATTPVSALTGSRANFLAEIVQHVRRINPDVVHLHSSIAGLARLSQLRNLPTVYSPHCFAFERTDLHRMARFTIRMVEKQLAARVDCIFGVSPHEVHLARSLGAARVHLVPNFVVPRVLQRRSADVTPGRVVTIGRIGRQKDPKLFAAVARLVPEADFVWIGDGDEKSKQVLKDSNVACLGWCSRDRIDAELSTADVYLHTGAWEGAPLSAAEAAGSGVPVIARSIETMKSLGYWSGGASAEEIAAAIRSFLRNTDYRNEVAACTWKVAQQFDPREMGKSLMTGYGLTLEEFRNRNE